MSSAPPSSGTVNCAPVRLPTYHLLLATLPPFIASVATVVVNGIYEFALPWARVDVYLPGDKSAAFYTTLPVNVALQVGRDSSLPPGVYKSTAVGGLRLFVVAGRMSMFLLFVAFNLSALSVGVSILHYFRKGSLGYRSQILALILTVFLNFLSVIGYMILTLPQMGLSGSYLSGLVLAAINTSVGVVCMVVSFLADAMAKLEAIGNNTSTRTRADSATRRQGSLLHTAQEAGRPAYGAVPVIDQHP